MPDNSLDLKRFQLTILLSFTDCIESIYFIFFERDRDEKSKFRVYSAFCFLFQSDKEDMYKDLLFFVNE